MQTPCLRRTSVHTHACVRNSSKSHTLLMLFMFFCMSLIWLTNTAYANLPVRFARTPSLSPDGKTIAFSWRGDLWKVSARGGVAQRLTAHQGYDALPIWSPDGKSLAFASRRHGANDIYIMSATGGVPKRLTYHSSVDTPAYWSNDGKRIFFRSRRGRTTTTRYRMFSISTQGGMPQLAFNLHSAGAALSPQGKYIAFARGSGRWWRKRWKGPFHSRLWLYTTQTKAFKALTPSGYVADFPSWVDSSTVIYRSEKSGFFNLWKYDLKTQKHTQLTSFKDKDIRFPSAARNGSAVVFARWDRIYIWDVTKSSLREVKISALADIQRNLITRTIKRRGVREYAVAPSGKEVALIVRGNLYIKGIRDPHPWARPVGASFWRERQVAWSPRGEQIAFVSDRHQGRNAIYIAQTGTRRGRSLPLHKTLQPTIQRLSALNQAETEHSPAWSPDGKTLAYIRGRGKLVLHHFPTKTSRTRYSSWNIGAYAWSPDGRWIVFEQSDAHSSPDIFLLRVQGKSKPINISRFPDSDFSPVWSANGRVLAFLSRNIHNRNAIQYIFLRHTDHNKSKAQIQASCRSWKRQWKKHLRSQRKVRALRLKKQIAAWKKRHLAKKKTAKTQPSSRPARTASKVKQKPVQKKRTQRQALRVRITQLAHLPFRIRSVPFVPGFQGAQSLRLSPTGCQMYFTSVGRGVSGLYRVNLFGKGLKRIAKGRVSKVSVQADGTVHFLSRGSVYTAKARAKRPTPIRFRAEQLVHQTFAYLQKFEEGWHLLNEWFYDPTFHGANWSKLHTQYRQLVRHVTNNVDFDDAVRMLLGELNASHLGIYSRYKGPRDHTADLGIQWGAFLAKKGRLIESVRQRSAAGRLKKPLRTGDRVLAIDGQPLTATTNVYQLLNHRAGRIVSLRIRRKTGQLQTLAIQPVGQRKAGLERYLSWLDQTRAKVKRWSAGLLSYAHIRSMGLSSLNRFERALLAHTYGTQALVIDVRDNGGGWTADLLLTMFFPKPHAYTRWRGSRKGYPAARRPFFMWHKPSILLCNERSVSNAEIFSHAYKNLKLGRLVGMPTYGGVISTRTIQILDKTWFRIPLRGWWALPTKKNMENGPAVPTDLVPVHPSDEINKRDPQLRKAVQLLLKKLSRNKK